MYLNRYHLRNFRRLENVEIKLQQDDTVFVGANNSGKTSATAAFRSFISYPGDFKIHDFSASLINQIDDFGKLLQVEEKDYAKLPAIELDLWFSISLEEELGRVADLLPTIFSPSPEVGMRIRFAIKNPEELYKDYQEIYPSTSAKPKPLSYFLSHDDRLKRYYGLQYFSLEQKGNELVCRSLDKEKGHKAINSLLLVNYVEAQRNIDDNNSPRSNRLSNVFESYYKQNLSEKKPDNDAVLLIDKSNDELTEHYQKEFLPIIRVIKSLGFPGLNERAIRVISNLSPEKALGGNTAIAYIESETKHELPEAYNGLGYKNLIYIVIQIAQFFYEWIGYQEDRPLCQLIFIEEPEVHLHAQVQQTFIRQIRSAISEIEKGISQNTDYSQQLIITTHSSHIVNDADFHQIRYFRRIRTKYAEKANILAASEVLNLASFDPTDDKKENVDFLQKFLKLTHCDLFFADAAILVEGTVERLLMPLMIKKEAPELASTYLTVLELGGAYSHRFIPLLKFINLPTLIITDLDAVDNTSHHPICRADQTDAITGNASIKELTREKSITNLLQLSKEQKIINMDGYDCYLTFQQSIPVPCYGDKKVMIPRTFEEAFIYENITKVRENKLTSFVAFSSPSLNFETDYAEVYETIKSKGYKKVEFALAQIEKEDDWKTPTYITEGLQRLRCVLKLNTDQEDQSKVENFKDKVIMGEEHE